MRFVVVFLGFHGSDPRVSRRLCADLPMCRSSLRLNLAPALCLLGHLLGLTHHLLLRHLRALEHLAKPAPARHLARRVLGLHRRRQGDGCDGRKGQPCDGDREEESSSSANGRCGRPRPRRSLSCGARESSSAPRCAGQCARRRPRRHPSAPRYDDSLRVQPHGAGRRRRRRRGTRYPTIWAGGAAARPAPQRRPSMMAPLLSLCAWERRRSPSASAWAARATPASGRRTRREWPRARHRLAG